MTTIVLMMTLGSALTACNGSTSSSSNSQDLSYQYNENNCDTGKQSFSSNGDYCTGLQNDALNNYCASDLRQQAFQTNCPGAVYKPF